MKGVHLNVFLLVRLQRPKWSWRNGNWPHICVRSRGWTRHHARVGSPFATLQWRHNEHDGVSSHQPHDCLLNRLFKRRSKKRTRLCITGLCVGNSPVTSEFPAQRASHAENVSILWHHHENVARRSDGISFSTIIMITDCGYASVPRGPVPLTSQGPYY